APSGPGLGLRASRHLPDAAARGAGAARAPVQPGRRAGAWRTVPVRGAGAAASVPPARIGPAHQGRRRFPAAVADGCRNGHAHGGRARVVAEEAPRRRPAVKCLLHETHVTLRSKAHTEKSTSWRLVRILPWFP